MILELEGENESNREREMWGSYIVVVNLMGQDA